MKASTSGTITPRKYYQMTLESSIFFSEKLIYKVKNFLAIDPTVSRFYFWSNLQPNLKRSTQVLNLKWDDFRLTRSIYRELKESLEIMFPGNGNIVFTTRTHDTDLLPGEVHDLNFFSIERGSDYRGESGLFRQTIESVLESTKIANIT